MFNRGMTISIVNKSQILYVKRDDAQHNHSIPPCIFCISSVISVFLSFRFSISSSTFLFCRSTISRFLPQLLQPFRWYSVIDSSEIDWLRNVENISNSSNNYLFSSLKLWLGLCVHQLYCYVCYDEVTHIMLWFDIILFLNSTEASHDKRKA